LGLGEKCEEGSLGRKLRRKEERSIELKRGRERSLEEAGCFCFLLRFSNQRYLRLLDRRRLSGRYKHNYDWVRNYCSDPGGRNVCIVTETDYE
jgi:hypothetical protein